MVVDDVGREGWRLAVRAADAAVAMSVVAGYIALGAAVLVGRSLLGVVRPTWPWLSGANGPPLRHHAGRVRERVLAAKQTARASGLLSQRDR